MSEDQFWDATPKFFWFRVKGYYERIEFEERQAWERTRYLAWAVLSPHVKKGTNWKPQSLFQFEDEKEAQQIDFNSAAIKARIREMTKK